MLIEKLTAESRKSLFALYRDVTASLRREGVKQWDRFYPNRFVNRYDLKQGSVFGIREGELIVGAVVVDRRFSARYEGLAWQDAAGAPAAIHRLAVRPDRQGRGLGKRLLRFAEEYALEAGSTSIRLDVYSGNPAATAMYERAGYRVVGTVRYPLRKEPYLCMEKRLDPFGNQMLAKL